MMNSKCNLILYIAWNRSNKIVQFQVFEIWNLCEYSGTFYKFTSVFHVRPVDHTLDFFYLDSYHDHKSHLILEYIYTSNETIKNFLDGMPRSVTLQLISHMR